MKNNYKTKVVIGLAIIVFIVAGYFLLQDRNVDQTSSKLDSFAKCLKDKGAVMYGAFWCSHCKDQKNMFGASEKYLPYVECSNSDNSETQTCKNEEINGYPTWKFLDKTNHSGVMTLGELALKTGCVLPN